MSVNLTVDRNITNVIQYQIPNLTLLPSSKQVTRITLNQLKLDIAKLEKYLQEKVEEKTKQEQKALKEKIEKGIQELETIAEKINSLSTEIEALMIQFKEIAVEVNRNYHLIQLPPFLRQIKSDKSKLNCWRPLNIWDVHSSSIPTVVRRGAKFILTVKMVDLFNAERDK
jgi:DNA repair exonuclease SbcCD ATPase subunit